MKSSNVKNKIKNFFKTNTFFQDKFGFENGIDITDDNKVLFRKNIVIKNIIFITNLIYTLIFTVVSIGAPTNTTNWLLTVLLLPVTFFVNWVLGKMIKKGPDDKISQMIAMYIAAFYMFLSAILVYIKLKYGESGSPEGNYLSECGYILLYYSLLICAFYQDRRMLKYVNAISLILITILHFTVTYSIVAMAGQGDLIQFFIDFFTGTQFRDIVIRTILLGLFMLVLYIYVAMTNTIALERVKETSKRRTVENDYIDTVTALLKVSMPHDIYTEDEKKETEILCLMVKKLASLLSVDPNEIESYVNYAKLHIDYENVIDFDPKVKNTLTYLTLKSQAFDAIDLIKRVELKKKAEEILRHVLDVGSNANDDEFVKSARNVITDLRSQIILICDIYISLRSYRVYKKANNHKYTMEYMEKMFKVYFDSLVYDRFSKFDSDFETIFDEE